VIFGSLWRRMRCTAGRFAPFIMSRLAVVWRSWDRATIAYLVGSLLEGHDVVSVAFALLEQRARNPGGSEVIVVADIESRSPLES